MFPTREEKEQNETFVEAPRTMYPNHPAVAFYLELLQSCLTGELRPETYVLLQPGMGKDGLLQTVKRAAVPILQSLLRPLRLELVRPAQYDPSTRREGIDWPASSGFIDTPQRQTSMTRTLSSHLPECYRLWLEVIAGSPVSKLRVAGLGLVRC